MICEDGQIINFDGNKLEELKNLFSKLIKDCIHDYGQKFLYNILSIF